MKEHSDYRGLQQFINLNEIFDGQEQQSNSDINFLFALTRKYNTHSSQTEIVIAVSG